MAEILTGWGTVSLWMDTLLLGGKSGKQFRSRQAYALIDKMCQDVGIST